MDLSLTMDAELIALGGAVAAGQTTQTPTAIATRDAQSAVIATYIGSIASGGVVTVTPQYSIDGGSNYVDLTDDAITFADTDDNKLAVVEFTIIPRTVTQVRLKIGRATADSAIVATFGIRRKGRNISPAGATGAKAVDSSVKAVKRVSINV